MIFAALFVTALLLFYGSLRLSWRPLKLLCAGAGLTLILEMISLVALFISTGTWLYSIDLALVPKIFDVHPHLVGMPRKNSAQEYGNIRVSHNSSGFRGPEIATKNPSRIRIAAVGGSTTYGVGVVDTDTWPAKLQNELGDGFEVLNLGVPAHSTAEHVIFAAFLLPHYEPDIVLLHTGLNDFRMTNVENLEPDYASSHAPVLYANLGLCFEDHLPRIAILRTFVILLQRLGLSPICPYLTAQSRGKLSKDPDPKALRFYRDNLETLQTLITKHGAQTIFLPQILLTEAVKKYGYWWWVPFVPDDQMIERMSEYNAAMKEVAEQTNSVFVNSILLEPWGLADFSDASHLNSAANERFARIVAASIRKYLASEKQ